MLDDIKSAYRAQRRLGHRASEAFKRAPAALERLEQARAAWRAACDAKPYDHKARVRATNVMFAEERAAAAETLWARPAPVRAGHDSDAPSVYLEDPARAGLRHVETCKTGWYLDSDGSETVHGVVYQLPAKRGRARFLAGYADPWNDGAALLHLEIYESPADSWSRPPTARETDAFRDALRAADSIAERLADLEREYHDAYDAGTAYRDKRRELLERGRALVELARKLRAAFRARHDAAREAVTLESMSLACFGLDAAALAAEARRQQARDESEIRDLLRRVRDAREEYRGARYEIRRVDAAPRRWRADSYAAANYGAFWEAYDNAL